VATCALGSACPAAVGAAEVGAEPWRGPRPGRPCSHPPWICWQNSIGQALRAQISQSSATLTSWQLGATGAQNGGSMRAASALPHQPASVTMDP
jgi:hypothetical protein